LRSGERQRLVRISRHASILALAGAVAAVSAAVLVTVVPQVGAEGAGPTTTTTVASTTTTQAPTTTSIVPTTTAPPATTTTAPPPPADEGSLEPGDSGPAVLALQQRLTDLGFWLGEADGDYGRTTQQAVMAFQKANGLGRDGKAGPATQAALATASRPTPTSTVDGIEIDLDRQLLLVVQGGEVQLAFNTSTGTASTPTPRGEFAVDREIDGVRRAPLGDLYRPKYFHGGVAVHGSPSIPGYPASHGCARVSNPAMDHLWASGVLEVGTPVRVL
jgi:peptidoglycan hydrolase-like protein with peptidoglycan-binding domain